jgi:hypothetical protein
MKYTFKVGDIVLPAGHMPHDTCRVIETEYSWPFNFGLVWVDSDSGTEYVYYHNQLTLITEIDAE